MNKKLIIPFIIATVIVFFTILAYVMIPKKIDTQIAQVKQQQVEIELEIQEILSITAKIEAHIEKLPSDKLINIMIILPTWDVYSGEFTVQHLKEVWLPNIKKQIEESL